MNTKHALRFTTAISVALLMSAAYAAGDAATPSTDTSSTKTQTNQPMTGKQKATAIGATTGAVAGAVVGGPIGAVVGAAAGGYVGHEGTDSNGRVPKSDTTKSDTADVTVRKAQAALNEQGFNAGTADGQAGPNTQSAVRRFQAKNGLAQSGTLDTPTLDALGVKD